jgi:hypothetical protein
MSLATMKLFTTGFVIDGVTEYVDSARTIIELSYLNKHIRSVIISPRIGPKCLQRYYSNALRRKLPHELFTDISNYGGCVTGSSTLELFEGIKFKHRDSDVDLYFPCRKACVAFLEHYVKGVGRKFAHTNHFKLRDERTPAGVTDDVDAKSGESDVSADLIMGFTEISICEYRRCGFINSIHLPPNSSNISKIDVLDIEVSGPEEFDMTICSNLIWPSGKFKFGDLESVYKHHIKFTDTQKKYIRAAMRNTLVIIDDSRLRIYTRRGYILKDDMYSRCTDNELHNKFMAVNRH